jgi:hypothetical protein
LYEITVPNGRVLSTIRRANWEGHGVTPDIIVPAADAFRVAHLRAIDDLLATASPARREELMRLSILTTNAPTKSSVPPWRSTGRSIAACWKNCTAKR